MDTLFIKKLKKHSTNLGHDILSNVMTLKIIFFEKFEVYDGLYNCSCYV